MINIALYKPEKKPIAGNRLILGQKTQEEAQRHPQWCCRARDMIDVVVRRCYATLMARLYFQNSSYFLWVWWVDRFQVCSFRGPCSMIISFLWPLTLLVSFAQDSYHSYNSLSCSYQHSVNGSDAVQMAPDTSWFIKKENWNCTDCSRVLILGCSSNFNDVHTMHTLVTTHILLSKQYIHSTLFDLISPTMIYQLGWSVPFLSHQRMTGQAWQITKKIIHHHQVFPVQQFWMVRILDLLPNSPFISVILAKQ